MVSDEKKIHKPRQTLPNIFAGFYIIIMVQSSTCTPTQKFYQWSMVSPTLKSYIQNKTFKKINQKMSKEKSIKF